MEWYVVRTYVRQQPPPEMLRRIGAAAMDGMQSFGGEAPPKSSMPSMIQFVKLINA